MSNHYRLNVRFDLEDETQRRAAEYLTELDKRESKSRNRFIVEAVISFMEHQNNSRDFTLEDVRQVLREELSEVAFSAPAPVSTEYAAAETELTEEQKAENDENVLADLTAFF